ncbi:MAG: TonB-dependent receptor [Proteobacteria bacterium]|nr:TonB-dependent receptor [Pseudomonadota bacterium]
MIALWLGLALAAEVEVRVVAKGSFDPVVDAELQVDGEAARTDARGRVTVELADAGGTIAVSHPGHRQATVTVEPPLGKMLRIVLEPLPPGHEIVVEAFKPSPHLSQHIIDAEMARETPGTLEDIVRLAQSLPGVTVQREYAPGSGSMSVRGSSPGENRTLLDGIDIPYLYHFNQYASVVPTTQLEDLELLPSTFGAAYGDAVGGVIAARTKLAPPAALHGSVGMNFVMGSASLAVPLPKGAWFSASGRRSYQDLVGEQTAQYTLWPTFADWTLRTGRRDGPYTYELFAQGASDRYDRAAGELDVLDPWEQTQVPSFAYRRGFEIIGARGTWTPGATSARWVVAGIHDRLDGALSGNGSEKKVETGLRGRIDIESHELPVRIDSGAEVRVDRMRLEVVDPGASALLVAAEAPALARGVAVDAASWRMRGATWAQVHLIAGDFRIVPGLRLGADTMATPAVIEPRLAARWRLAEQTELKAAAGLYHQAPASEHLVEGTGDPNLSNTRSWQVGGGIEQTLASRLEITVETYAKHLEDPLVQRIDGPAETWERGDAWGVEMVSRYRLRETIFLRAWVGYARSTVVDSDGVRTPADGDQPLNLGFVGSWDLSKGFNLGLRYRLGSGLPYTPLDGSLHNAGTDAWLPIVGSKNSARLPVYQKVDLHAEQTWTFRRWELSLFLELWYVPKKSAQLYPTWNFDYTEQGWVEGPTFLPLLGARARF